MWMRNIMTSINAILLEYQQDIYLIPSIRFVSLARPKEITMHQKKTGDKAVAVFQGDEIDLQHSLEHSIYCAILHPIDAEKGDLPLVIPLSKAPKPINIRPQQIMWFDAAKNLATIQHPDYPGMLVEIL